MPTVIIPQDPFRGIQAQATIPVPVSQVMTDSDRAEARKILARITELDALMAHFSHDATKRRYRERKASSAAEVEALGDDLQTELAKALEKKRRARETRAEIVKSEFAPLLERIGIRALEVLERQIEWVQGQQSDIHEKYGIPLTRLRVAHGETGGDIGVPLDVTQTLVEAKLHDRVKQVYSALAEAKHGRGDLSFLTMFVDDVEGAAVPKKKANPNLQPVEA